MSYLLRRFRVLNDNIIVNQFVDLSVMAKKSSRCLEQRSMYNNPTIFWGVNMAQIKNKVF